MKEKQIEEMYNSLAVAYGTANQYDSHLDERTIEDMAKRLIEAGYRKQSEGEWNEDIIGFCNVCMSCGAIVERTAIKNRSGQLNFCPNCGAKMKGGEG